MDLASEFEEFAGWCADSSPLYERLARGVADDPRLRAVAEAVPEGRSPANLLFAATQYLLLDGEGGSLAEFYPTVVEDPLDPDRQDPLPAFRSFVSEHRERIETLVPTRRTQTNSVRRCGGLYPAFARVAETVEEPLALVEVGPSAGLNLLFDRYEYAYDLGEETRTVGAEGAPVRIPTRVRDGSPPLPADPPQVAERVGVDLNPIDVTDPDDRQWLQALVWPEHRTRHRLLAGALSVAREHNPEILAGDAIERLPDAFERLPADRPVCLFHTLVLYQLSGSQRERLRETVREVAEGRPVYWLSGDDPSETHDHGIDLELSRPGEASERLGCFEQHGQWVAWED